MELSLRENFYISGFGSVNGTLRLSTRNIKQKIYTTSPRGDVNGSGELDSSQHNLRTYSGTSSTTTSALGVTESNVVNFSAEPYERELSGESKINSSYSSNNNRINFNIGLSDIRERSILIENTNDSLHLRDRVSASASATVSHQIFDYKSIGNSSISITGIAPHTSGFAFSSWASPDKRTFCKTRAAALFEELYGIIV